MTDLAFSSSQKETIAAQATAPGRGGVGIIRISGPEVKNTEFVRCRKSVLRSNKRHTVYAKKCCRYLKHCYGKRLK